MAAILNLFENVLIYLRDYSVDHFHIGYSIRTLYRAHVRIIGLKKKSKMATKRQCFVFSLYIYTNSVSTISRQLVTQSFLNWNLIGPVYKSHELEPYIGNMYAFSEFLEKSKMASRTSYDNENVTISATTFQFGVFYFFSKDYMLHDTIIRYFIS